MAERVRWEPFAGREAGTFDVEHVLGVVVHHLGPDDERVGRIRRLAPGERP